MNKRIKLFNVLKKIPEGKVATYKLLAEKIGTSPRAVGAMLHSNTNLLVVPCHRVVKSDYTLGGYKTGVKAKLSLLRREGVKINKGRVESISVLKKL